MMGFVCFGALHTFIATMPVPRSGELSITPIMNRQHINFLFIALVSVCFLACSNSKSKPVGEAVPSPVPVEVKQKQLAALPPPELDQVNQALARVFKSSVVMDTSQQPQFLAGDFNGDLSQDIAIVVKPAPGKLADVNQELPSWMTRDLLQPNNKSTVPIAENDLLLAIIHGYGDKGWRDEQATQTFLIKNAVGSRLTVQPGKPFVAANAGKELPRIHGDLINEVLRGASGYLYYTGPTYGWYDPKTFKGEPHLTAVHGKPK
jgi:hypothetical protein